MSEFTAYFRAQLLGKTETLNGIRELYEEARKLERQKIELRVDMRNLDNQIKEVQQRLNLLRADKKDLINTEHTAAELKEINKQIRETEAELLRLQAAGKAQGIDMNNTLSQLDETKQAIKDIENELNQEYHMKFDGQGAREELISIQDVLENIGNLMEGIGGALQGFGNFMGNTVGGAFSSMAGMFDTDFLHYAKLWTSKAVTQTFFDNMAASSERYDILSTYNDYLAIMGISEDVASKSLEKLNLGIQGLPLGLSDVAFQARRYAMYMGNDIDRATDFVLGMNRALIAGGANEQMRRTTTYELERLMSVGKLNTARQWNALLQGLGVSVKFLQEQMGTADMSIQDFAEALSNGDIATEEFLDAIATLQSNEGLNAAVDIYKGTIESSLSNLQFALIRGKANVIDTFNEMLEEVTGTGIAGTLNKVRDQLNEVFFGIQDYIKERPEMLATAIDAIMGVVERAKGFDWAGTADKIFTNLGRMLEIMVNMWDRLPEGAVSDFVAFSLTWAGPLGNAFKALSSGLPFMFALFDRMKDFDYESLATKVFDAVGNVISTFASILQAIPDSALEKLITFGLVYASPLGKAFSGIGRLIGLLATSKLLSGFGILGKAGGATAMINLGNSLKSFFLSFAGITMMNASIAEVGGLIYEFGVVAEKVGAMDFGNFAQNIEQLAPSLMHIGAFISGASAVFGALHYGTGGTSSLAILAGEGLTAGIVTIVWEVAHVIESFAHAATAVSEASIPSSNKIKKLGEAIGGIMTNFDIDPSKASRIASNKTAFGNLSSIVRSVAGMGESLKEINDLDMSPSAIMRAGDQAKRLVESVGGIFKQLQSSFQNEEGTFIYWDKSRSGSIVDILDNMNDAIGSLSSIGTTIENMTPVLARLMNQWVEGPTRFEMFKERVPMLIGQVAEMFVDIRDAFAGVADNDKNPIPGFSKEISSLGFATAETGQLQTILDNMTTAMTSLQNIAEAIEGPGGLSAALTRLTTDYTGEGSNRLVRFRVNVRGLISAVGGVFKWIKEAFTKGDYADLFGASEATGSASGIINNMRNAIKDLSSIANMISQNGGTLSDLLADQTTTGLGGHGAGTYDSRKKPLMSQYVEDVSSMMTSLGRMVNAVYEVFPDANDGKLRDAYNSVRALAGNEGVVHYLADVMTRLYNMKDKVSDLTGGGESFDLGKDLGKIFGGLSGLFDTLITGSSNVYAMEPASKSLLAAVENIQSVVSWLGLMGDTTTRLAGGEEGFSMGTQLTDIFTGLMDAMSVLGGDSGSVEETSGAFANLAQSFEEVASQGEAAQQAVNDVTEAVNNVASAMSGQSGVLNSFASHLNYVGAMASGAAGMVRSLQSAIDALQSKEITIRVNYSSSGQVSMGNAFRNNAMATTGRANGGLIYRAGGGFTPRGTDTVPAMLTPGEYVHRRAAVKLFGEEFMNRINNLDLTGALNSLVMRAGANIIPRGAATINATYTKDNHATVNQKIYTNNPNYGFRRANRYVKAL